jgi:hypothetical protein
MNKGLEIVPNIDQYILYNSSKFHYLTHPRKGVIEKIADLAKLWIILESELVEKATHGILNI